MSSRPDTAPARPRTLCGRPANPFLRLRPRNPAPRDSGPARNTPPQSRLIRALRRDAQKAALHELQG